MTKPIDITFHDGPPPADAAKIITQKKHRDGSSNYYSFRKIDGFWLRGIIPYDVSQLKNYAVIEWEK